MEKEKNKNPKIKIEWLIRHPGTGEKIECETFEQAMDELFEGFNIPFKFINNKREPFNVANKRVKDYFDKL